MNQKILDQVKQAAFEDEMQKVAVSEGLWARAAERSGNRIFIHANPDARGLIRKQLEAAASSSKGGGATGGLFNYGPLAKLQHPWISKKMLKSTERINPKFGLRDTAILKNILKIGK